jgi:predicted dehydrogenase
VTGPHKVAIIGTGGIAAQHIDALRQNAPRVEVVAGMDVDPERVQAFCARQGIPHVYTDTAKMLAAERPALVHICTPPSTHTALAIQCLEAGAWVLCEKPLCASLAEFDQISEAERRTGRYVSTVFQWRFGSAAQHLKRLIQSGEMGRPLVGLCQTLWYRDLAYYAVPWRGKWATELGGVTMGHGIHLMDLFLWLMGDWQEIYALIGTLDRPIEVEDLSMALVRFENGALGNVTTSVLSPRQETYLRLDFQRATVEVSALYSAANANWQYSVPQGAAYADTLARWQTIESDVPGAHPAQVAVLLDSLDRGTPPAVQGKEGRRILEFIASLYKSAFTGQPVRRGSITPQDPFYQAMNGVTEAV